MPSSSGPLRNVRDRSDRLSTCSWPPTLAFALLALAAACERAPRTDEPAAGSAARVLVFAHTSTEGSLRRLYDDFERGFEASRPGVDLRQMVMDDDDYQKFGLLNLFSGSSSPDIYFQWGGYLIERDARAGFCLDLTPRLRELGLDARFIPERRFGGDFEGRTYLLPQTLDLTVVLFFNRVLFARAGVAPPRDWPDFLRITDRLRAIGVTPLVAGNKDLWMAGNWAAHIASRVVGEDVYHASLSLSKAHRFDAPEWVEALERLAELVSRRAFLPGAASMTDAEAVAEFIAGRAAMIPNGAWVVTDILKARAEGATIDYGFFNTPPIPGGRGDQTSAMAVTNGFCVGGRSRDPELALACLEELLRPERQRRWAAEGVISPVRGVGGEGFAGPAEEVMTVLQGARRIVSPPDTGYAPAAWTAFFDAVQQVLAGNRAPAEALAEAERAIEIFESRQ
jgi:raffinose/stachyose/melibiose transport system substrate-binding protein